MSRSSEFIGHRDPSSDTARADVCLSVLMGMTVGIIWQEDKGGKGRE